MILLCVYLCSTQGGFLFASLPEKRVSPFHSDGVLHLSALAQTTRCLCAKKWANPFHHGCVLQNSFPVQYRSYTTPRHLILLSMCYWITQSPQSLTGGFLPIALTRLTFAILAVFGGVSTQNLFLHNEWTKVSLNLQHMAGSAVPPKLRYAPSVRIASQSMMC